ncbi:unnamed protein product [Rotaria sp. Silwood1]|nr:unnamed protein product [Rotaria sp. Silwood1]
MNFCQCRKWPNLPQNKKNIYERLYNATYRSLSSLLPPLCSQVLFNDSNIQSQYISPKGLSDRVIPIGTFPSAILALEYLYGAVCPIRNLPTRENAIQSFDLVHPRTDEERQAKINTICNVTQRFCTGTLQQYSNQGNVICRFVHTYFVPLLPSIHCPHVGPTGGGACTDKTIDFYYNQTNFLACAHKQ